MSCIGPRAPLPEFSDAPSFDSRDKMVRPSFGSTPMVCASLHTRARKLSLSMRVSQPPLSPALGVVLGTSGAAGACAGAVGGDDAWPCADLGHKLTRTAAMRSGASADATS